MKLVRFSLVMAVMAGLSAQEEAFACGGLFCSAVAPVEQTAERIVFANDGKGSITAIIEVQYEGPSEKFAWLLPMPGVPSVDVSTVEVLNSLDVVTEPSYQLEYRYGDNCVRVEYEESLALADNNDVQRGAEDTGIDVLDSGTAGPYDYVTISADPELEDAAQAAIDWLVDNGYDVGATGPDVLRPYLAEGLNLVAFRLTKGNDVGAIRPVKLTYDGDLASIPIRPTAVAAVPDMGIRVFLLDQARSVSQNYLSLELNEARINWFNWRSNYDEVVSLAADEAGGRGFVTEYAGDTERFSNQIWDDYMDQRWSEIQAFDGTGAELLMDARSPFRSYEGFRRAVEAAVMLPDGVTLDEFATDPIGYQERYGTDLVDTEIFLHELENEVVNPLRSAQELVSGYPYLSRLYTTLSPEEMTEDPQFVANPELPDVSNVHQAVVDVHCEKGMYPEDSPYTITLSDGTQIHGESLYQSNDELQTLPAARTVIALSDDGDGEVLEDNTEAIQAAVAAMAPVASGDTNTASEPDSSEPDPSASDPGNTDAGASEPKKNGIASTSQEHGGCSVTTTGGAGHTPLGVLTALVFGLGTALYRRRQRG